MQMVLNIYIFLKGKLKQEVELIQGMSDRSKLKPWGLQIYHEPDPVVAFKIYSEKRPEHMNKHDAPFYLDVNHIAKTL